jgi:hypothetical protein
MTNVYCNSDQGEIASSNSFNYDMGARLADFGLAELLQSFNYSCHHNSTSILGPRGSIGYIAPGDFFYFKEIFQYHDCFCYLLVFRSYISTLCQDAFMILFI